MHYFRLSFVLIPIWAIAFDAVSLQDLTIQIARAQGIEGDRTETVQAYSEQKRIADQKVAEAQAPYEKSQFHAALKSLQEALTLYREISDHKGEGSVLGKLGLVYYRLGDYKKAIAFQKQSLNLSQKIEDRIGEINALGNLGNIYFYLSRYEEALVFYKQSLAISHEVNDRSREAQSLGHLGNVYSHLGNYEKAIALHNQSLAISREIQDRSREAQSLGNIGNAYSRLSDYKKAIAFHKQSLAIKRKLEDNSGETSSLTGLGNVYHNIGEYEKTIVYYNQSLAIEREFGDRLGQVISLGNLGFVHISLGEYEKAIALLKHSLAIAQDIKYPKGEGEALGNLGLAYYRLGEYEKAITYQKQSLTIKREIKYFFGEAASLGNLGIAYISLGDYERAITFFEQSLAISQAIRNRLGKARALGTLGALHSKLGQFQQSLEFSQQYLAIAHEIDNRSGEEIALHNIGTTLFRMKQPQLAIAFYKQSINTTESIRGDNPNLTPEQHQSYLQTIESKYRTLAKLLLQEERIIEALQVLDLLKVQELQDFFKDVDGNERTSKGIEFFPEEEKILGSVNISQNSDLYAHFQSADIQDLSQTLQQTARDRNLSLASYQDLNSRLQSLSRDSALLYPLLLGDRLELILFTPNRAPIRKTVSVSETELQATIRSYRESLQNPRDAGVLERAQQINDWLLRPLEKDLQEANVKTIIYAPDGALRYVPLAALHDGEQWAIEKYQINYVTAFGLTEADRPNSGAPKIIAGAYTDKGTTTVNINQTPFRFSSIPAARPEAVEVSKRFRGTKLLLEENFNKATLTSEQLNRHNIVHLATHGKLVSGNPSESFILLNNGEYVTLREIKNWTLPNVDLVVLSACETALGEELANGIEIIGFGYQLQVAQARAAIASLWQVNDSSTYSLMNLFYDQLKEGERSPTIALGEAQRTMIQSASRPISSKKRAGMGPQRLNQSPVTFSHPYYWAPFILIGNGL